MQKLGEIFFWFVTCCYFIFCIHSDIFDNIDDFTITVEFA